MVLEFGKDDDRRGSYIAGRSGAKPTTKKQEQSASFQAGKTERDREQRIRTGTTTKKDREQILNIAEKTGKNPYGAQEDEGGIVTLGNQPRSEDPVSKFVDEVKAMGGINPIGVAFGKGMDLLTKPQKGDFLDEKDLAAMALNLQGKTEEEQQEFFDTYRDIFSDAFKDEMDQFEKDQGFSVNPDDLLKQKFDTALKKSQRGALGKGSQTVTDPVAAYKDMNAVTTSQQVDIARLDPRKYPELADKIFQARMDLDQKGKNPFTGNPTDSGGGITNVNTGGGNQTGTDTTDPGFPDYRFRDLGIAPFASYNPDDVMVDFSNYQATRGPLSSITNAKDGGIMRAADGAMVSISMTPLPITNIQEIKMDKQKYRDNMIREEIARSSMAKDVDLAPNFSMDA